MTRSLLVAALALLAAFPALAQQTSITFVTLSADSTTIVIPDLPVVIVTDDPDIPARMATTDASGGVPVVAAGGTARRYFGYPAPGSDYVTEFAIPAIISVTPVSTVITNGFARLQPISPQNGVVRGRVTDAVTGEALGIGFVQLATTAGPSPSGVIDGSGDYALQIEPGTYEGTLDIQRDLFDEGLFYRAQAVSFTVEAGGEVTLDVVAEERLQGTATGLVTDAETGAPVSNAEVQAYATDGSVYQPIQTDAAGRFTSEIPSGDYIFFVADTTSGYLPQVFDGATSFSAATVVTVTAGATTPDIDFALDRIADDFAVTLTGRVTDTGGAPVAAGVRIFDRIGLFDAFSTEADGTFSFSTSSRTLAASQLAIEFGASGFVREYFDDKPSLAVADLIQIGGQAVTLDLGDIVLETEGEDIAGLAITGTVRDEDTGEALAGALVAVSRLDAPGVRYGLSDATGAYRIDGLDAGRYVVLFTETDHAPEFFPDAATSTDADVLDIDQDTGGVNGLMGGLNRPVGTSALGAVSPLRASGGDTIRGTVRDASGVAVAGALVTAHGSNGPQAYALSDAAGRFTLSQTDDFVTVRVDRPRFALSSSAMRASTGGQLFVTLDASAPTSGETEPSASVGLRVYPNPVRGRATVAFSTEAPGEVRVALYDVLGREVAVAAQGERAAGAQEVTLDTAGLAPGVYVVRTVAGGVSETRTLTVVR